MRSLPPLVRAYPGRSVLLVLCLVLAAVSGGVSLLALLPLLSVAMRPERGPSPEAGEGALGERLLSLLETVGLEPTLVTLLVIIAGAMMTKGALSMLANKQIGYTVAHVAMDLRLSLLRALMNTRWSYFTRVSIGAINNAFATEAGRAANAYLYGAQVVAEIIGLGIALAIALALSVRLTLVTLAIGAVFLLSRGVLVAMTRRAGQKQTRLMWETLAHLTDALQAMKPLRAMGREWLLGPMLERQAQRINRAAQKQVLSKQALNSLDEPMVALYLCVGLYFALGVWHMPVDEVLVLAIVFSTTLSRIGRIQRKYQHLVSEESAYFSITGSIQKAEAEWQRSEGSAKPSLSRAIAIREVDLAYDGTPVLNGASLEIPVGKITAFIGPSGSGKTTLADLVIGLVNPDVGAVFVDEVALPEIDLQQWRSTIGYVPQEMFLLHDTVAQNVTLGETTVTAAEVEDALRRAGAWDFVSRLPEGAQTVVGERGALLSGGQRQRVAIARALVHRPSLLILDEATTSLDPETERLLWDSVEKLRGETTILAISHQPALASIADRIYRIEHGKAIRVPEGLKDGTQAWRASPV